MALQGQLRTMTLAELLQWMSLGQKTGTLTLHGDGVEKKIVISEGRVLSSSSSDPREYLGHFLVAHGYITEEELRKSMQVQEESRILLGKILVMIGAIAEDDLTRLMRLKLAESVYDAFLWSDGDFRFTDDDLPDMSMVPLSVDLTGIIMEGHRRADEWRRIRRRVESGHSVPRLLRAPDPSSLSDQEKHFVRFIDGRRTIEQISLECHSPEFHVAKFVFELVEQDAASVISPSRSADFHQPTELPAGNVEERIAVLLTAADDSLDNGDATAAWHSVQAAMKTAPQSKPVREKLKATEQALVSELDQAGIRPDRIPLLAMSPGELTEKDFTANEGFLLSRINGNWDVKSILKISPIRELEALVILRRLSDQGVISFRSEDDDSLST